MITPSFSLTATERVLPKLALDFTTANLDPRVTFTRTGNTATVTNSLGLIAPINADLPRFDFDPITLVCKGLLIEEARTNLALYSEQFNNAYWQKLASTITANAIIAPDGTLTGDALVENTATAAHYMNTQSGINVTSGTTYAFSVYAKYNGRNLAFVTNGNGFGGSRGAVFDLQNGTIHNIQPSTIASITNVGNSIYRCTITATATINTLSNINYSLTDDLVSFFKSYTGNGTSGVYLWGAQIEVGAFPSSYIPTTTTALTRNADLAAMTGTNFSDWYNASEGAFVFDYDIPVNRSFGAVAGLGQGTFNTSIRFNVVNAMRATGTSFPNTVVCGTAVLGANKMACALKVNDYRSFVNGVSNGTDTNATMIPSPNEFKIGKDEDTDNVYANGWIRKIFYYPQRLTNAELAAFSK